MPALLLLRHGKSDWDAGTKDEDRQLTARGRRAAKAVGLFLTRIGAVPDMAVTSPAERARTTLDLAVEAGRWPCPVRVAGELYRRGPESVLTLVRAEDPSTTSLLLVGHEPTWSAVVESLTGAAVRLPTGTLVRIELERWTDAVVGGGSLTWLVPPRLLDPP
ncbi:MAG TPA: histidine phosphatase family protein [Acidimicrobiales bacterium]|jgi:phosphohistidine phosphatase